jgi:hypothetical protein
MTLGGVDTDEISSKTFEAKNAQGLYFIGEAIDITCWLGSYNFQFPWSSGVIFGQAVKYLLMLNLLIFFSRI